jgi:hypothetical protein
MLPRTIDPGPVAPNTIYKERHMDPVVGAVIVIALFGLVVVAAFLVFRQRGRVKIHGPFNTDLEMDVTNTPEPPTPGVRIERAKSRRGGLLAEDQTGRGAEVKDVEVEDDILVGSSLPLGNDKKKVGPPA